MPIVYRVENADSIGPYRGGFCGGYIKEDLYSQLRHPSPPDKVRDGSYIFGFRNKKELCGWFMKETLDNLTKSGYNVVCYIVGKSSIVNCNKHIAFLRSTKGNCIR